MAEIPNESVGVGERPDETVHTELLDFLAREGLKKIYLLTNNLRRLNQEYPHHTQLAADTYFLSQLAAFIELGLTETGYSESDISRVASSTEPNPRSETT